MSVHPYLYFDGKCEEALEFYRTELGATDIFIMRFKESPDPNTPPDNGEKVMHSSFQIGGSQLWASDGHCGGKAVFQGFALTYTAADDSEADRIFGLLGNGGQVLMPVIETFFASRFGMVADKFGVQWMVIKQKPM